MRLIDADALIEAIVNRTGSETVLFNTTEELNAYLTGCAYKQNAIIDMINDLPTAYDVEKVVAELEEERVSHFRLIENSDNQLANAYAMGRSDGSIKAKEIVRKGGAV